MKVVWKDRCGTVPVHQVLTLWITLSAPGPTKRVSRVGFGGKRSCALWMLEGLMLLQLDPLDHHFDPEGQVATLWVSRYPSNNVANLFDFATIIPRMRLRAR